MIGIVVLFFVLILAIFSGIKTKEEAGDLSQEAMETVAEDVSDISETEALAEGQLLYGGELYEYNTHLSNYLFLGIDTSEAADVSYGRGAGQSDAIYLVSWDRITGDTTLITIPRDTMTLIELFSYDGDSIGYFENHLSLAYAYGDGSYGSCKLAVNAVSKLFYDIPIQGYAAMTLDGISALVEEIGDLEVTIPNDSLSDQGSAYEKGQTLTITPENVENFVRSRDTNIDNSALDRMERQQAFLDVAYQRILQNYQTNPGTLSSLYLTLSDHMVTNMSTDQFAKILSGLSGDGQMDRWTLPGEAVVGDFYDEYHVDQELLLYQIIDTFYTKVE
jgi:LCP family protein required for cell wall assembly